MNTPWDLFLAYLNADAPLPWTPDTTAGLALADRLEELQSPWAATLREIVSVPLYIPADRSVPLLHGREWAVQEYHEGVAVRGFPGTAFAAFLEETYGQSSQGIDLPESRPDATLRAGADLGRVLLVTAIVPTTNEPITGPVVALQLKVLQHLKATTAGQAGGAA